MIRDDLFHRKRHEGAERYAIQGEEKEKAAVTPPPPPGPGEDTAEDSEGQEDDKFPAHLKLIHEALLTKAPTPSELSFDLRP